MPQFQPLIDLKFVQEIYNTYEILEWKPAFIDNELHVAVIFNKPPALGLAKYHQGKQLFYIEKMKELDDLLECGEILVDHDNVNTLLTDVQIIGIHEYCDTLYVVILYSLTATCYLMQFDITDNYCEMEDP